MIFFRKVQEGNFIAMIPPYMLESAVENTNDPERKEHFRKALEESKARMQDRYQSSKRAIARAQAKRAKERRDKGERMWCPERKSISSEFSVMDYKPLLPPFYMKDVVCAPDALIERLRTSEEMSADQIKEGIFQSAHVKPSQVDALNSLEVPPTKGGKTRIVFDAQHATEPGSWIARQEGDPPCGDATVDVVFDKMGLAYDFFESFGVVPEGPMVAIIRYGEQFPNVFRVGKTVVFGESTHLLGGFTQDPTLVLRSFIPFFLPALDDLDYAVESGAIYESMCDVFAVLIERYNGKDTWFIGQGIFLRNEFQEMCLRSLAHPGTAYDHPLFDKDRQPKCLNDHIPTWEAKGGVHILSGIPNHAFYLAMEPGSERTLGNVWMQALGALENKVTPTLEDFAYVTLKAAPNVEVMNLLHKAWIKVGVFTE